VTKTVSAGLATHLAGTQLTLATCWRVARQDGVVMGFTDHDADLIIDGVTYAAATGISRSAIDTQAGNRVGNLEITALLTSDAITAADLASGRFKGAEVFVFRVNWADSSQGPLKLMRGWIGRLTVRDNDYVAEVEGLAKRLTNEIVELYSTECLADLGDERCKKDISGWHRTGAVASVVSDRVFTVGLSEADGFWENGLITWTSGHGAGLTSDIRAYTVGRIELMVAPPLGMTVGDSFTLDVGCNKQISTCKDKFDNVVNFRGYGLHMPGRDELLWYATPKPTS
jgi:uncharacterized phage protein (TIGR02218 family)